MGKRSSLIVEPEIQLEEIRTSKREKVGILGGTFNPPHLGHLIVAEQVKDQLDLDKIIFLPTDEPPHSSTNKKTISASIRAEMLELAIENNHEFEIEYYEIDNGGKNYTYDTMRNLIDLYPTVDFYFIVGADMVVDLPTWHRIDELVELVQFVGVKRSGTQLETDYPIIIVDTPLIDISSSLIRRKVKNKSSIKYMVPTEVEKFIKKKELYQNE